MTLEELQKKYVRLLEKVRMMRGRQKEYFKWRAQSDLQAARRYEKEVDAIIEAEVKIQKSNQQTLL
jgi:hypothetical protein